MNLEEAEKMLMKQIDDMGLKRVVFHRDVISHRKSTVVFLIPKEDNDRWEETPEDMMFPQRKHNIKGIGTSHCSWKDVWNRKKGRVIALARAIKSMEADNDKGFAPRKIYDEEGLNLGED
jgi:hypothetical protein